MLWTDATTALVVAAYKGRYNELQALIQVFAYANRPENSGEDSEKGRHGPHDLAPRSRRRRVREKGLFTVSITLRKRSTRIQLRA